MLSVPLVRSIYGAVKDMIGLFGDAKGPALKVVSLTLPGERLAVLGFVTRSDFADLPPGVGARGSGGLPADELRHRRLYGDRAAHGDHAARHVARRRDEVPSHRGAQDGR